MLVLDFVACCYWTMSVLLLGLTVFCVDWRPHEKSHGWCVPVSCVSVASAVWPLCSVARCWRAVLSMIGTDETRKHAAQRHACLPCAMSRWITAGLRPWRKRQHPCSCVAAWQQVVK